MNIKGSFAKINSQTIWELATHVIEYNTQIADRLKQDVKEQRETFKARPWWYRMLYDYPHCWNEKWQIGNCEDAIDHATNLVRLCVNTTDDVFLSPQDAAFLGLNDENENNG